MCSGGVVVTGRAMLPGMDSVMEPVLVEFARTCKDLTSPMVCIS